MATAAPDQSMPLMYRALEPLNSTQHSKMKVRSNITIPQLAKMHAVPVTVDEFGLASATIQSSSRSARIQCRLR